jgi:hypothetical protein
MKKFHHINSDTYQRINIFVSKELLKLFKKKCKKNETTMSNVVRKLLVEYINK